ncbi:MAG: histidine kinase [Flavobacteriales bacterium]|nr:histidine kinase [Flavobacteriales bacterium]
MNNAALLVGTLCLVGAPAVAQEDGDSQWTIREGRAKADTTRLEAWSDLVRDGLLFTDRDSALGIARMMYDTAMRMGSTRYMAAALGLQAKAMAMQGSHAAALKLYGEALALSRKSGDINGQAALLKDIGGTHFMMGQAYDGLAYMERAWALKKGAGDASEAGILTSMALANTKMERYAEADAQARKALAIAELIKDPKEVQYAATALGDNELRRGHLQAALPLYEKSMKVAEDMGDKRRTAASLVGLSDLYARLGERAKAIAFGDRALAIAQAIGERSLLEQCYLNLYEVNKEAGNAVRALETLEQFTLLRDVIRSDENQAALLRQKTDFDYRLKEALLRAEMDGKEALAGKEIARQKAIRFGILVAGLLFATGGAAWYYNDRRRRQERFLKEKAVLQTQALRAQLNPHFLFNALNSINAFVQRNDADHTRAYLAKFAHVMRNVLENSRQHEVSLREDLETLHDYLELEHLRLERKFDFAISVERGIDPDKVLVPPLVVQPFVENAIWHGIAHMDGRGHISLRVEMRHCQLRWTIEDNGVGRSARSAPSGTGPGKSGSLGTRITRERLDLLWRQYGGRGDFRYEDLSHGTRVVVDLPWSSA